MNQVESLFNQLSKNQSKVKPIQRKLSSGKAKTDNLIINDDLMKSLRTPTDPIVLADNTYEWIDLDDSSSFKMSKRKSAPVFRAIS